MTVFLLLGLKFTTVTNYLLLFVFLMFLCYNIGITEDFLVQFLSYKIQLGVGLDSFTNMPKT